jgi:competence protein ComEA
MSRPRRRSPILWIALFATAGYFFYRWRQQQAQEASAPPAIAATPPPAPAPEAAPSAPRRIATRVHKGAPPSMPISTSQRMNGAPSAPPEPSAGEEPNAIAAPSLPAEPAELGEAPPAPAEEQAAAPLFSLPADEPAELPLGTAVASPGLVNINSADAEALIGLPGIGPALAQRIIEHRAANGPFASIDGLVDIRGIGPNNIDEFRHLITV